MRNYKVSKGLDIPLSGAPEPVIEDVAYSGAISVYPGTIAGIKAKVKVAEGDRVKRGSLLFIDKKDDSIQFTSPTSGVVKEVRLGARRALEEIVLEPDGGGAVEDYGSHGLETVQSLSRDFVLEVLLKSGLIQHIESRPFGNMARPVEKPKSIFVNGMNSGPFQPDINVVLKGQESAFQAGLYALGALTDGPVYLNLDGNREGHSECLTNADGVVVNTFSGPHPSGNTSIHIYHLDRIKPHDIVWAVKAVDVILIGRLLLEGNVPEHRVIALGGPGVKSEARKYYRVPLGSSLKTLLRDKLAGDDVRILNGDVLSGTILNPDGGLPSCCSGITVLPEVSERSFLGWLDPGFSFFSFSKAFLSPWLPKGKTYDLNTDEHGGHRAMVATGLYDRFMPMNIMVDYLIRAVLAHDTDEAVKLGILETAPEDFALCAYACPSKMNVVGIIREGLAEIEAEGI